MSGMEGENSNKGLLADALKRRDGTKAIHILSNHPELTNISLINEHEQETSTPLIEACRRGRWHLIQYLAKNTLSAIKKATLNFYTFF